MFVDSILKGATHVVVAYTFIGMKVNINRIASIATINLFVFFAMFIALSFL